jgi:uncharacterized damage-inducible protein DinB
MNVPLAHLFRHNRWANLRLLDACAALPPEHLEASAVGGYGSIRATFAHLAGAEERYARGFTGEDTHATVLEERRPDLATLREHLDASGRAFVAIAEGMDEDRVLTTRRRGEERQLPATLLLTQAINHATEHRTQIATILTQIGVQPPAMDGWTFAHEGEAG